MDCLVYYCFYFDCISYHFANNHPFDEKGGFINDSNINDSNKYDDKRNNNNNNKYDDNRNNNNNSERDRRRYSLMKKATDGWLIVSLLIFVDITSRVFYDFIMLFVFWNKWECKNNGKTRKSIILIFHILESILSHARLRRDF